MQQKLDSNGKEYWFEFPIFNWEGGGGGGVGGGGGGGGYWQLWFVCRDTDNRTAHLLCMV